MKSNARGTRRKTAQNQGAARTTKSARPAINPPRSAFLRRTLRQRQTNSVAGQTSGMTKAIGPLVKKPSATAAHPARCHAKKHLLFRGGPDACSTSSRLRQLRQKK